MKKTTSKKQGANTGAAPSYSSTPIQIVKTIERKWTNLETLLHWLGIVFMTTIVTTLVFGALNCVFALCDTAETVNQLKAAHLVNRLNALEESATNSKVAIEREKFDRESGDFTLGWKIKSVESSTELLAGRVKALENPIPTNFGSYGTNRVPNYFVTNDLKAFIITNW